VDGAGSGSCPEAGCCIIAVEPSCSTIVMSVILLVYVLGMHFERIVVRNSFMFVIDIMLHSCYDIVCVSQEVLVLSCRGTNLSTTSMQNISQLSRSPHSL